MIPKINFTHSDIYDIVLSKRTGITYKFNKWVEGMKIAKKFQSVWNKIGHRLLTEMSKAIGLEWKFKELDCFFSFNAPYSFSYPLTIHFKSGWSFDYVVTTLVHELAHRLFITNKDKILRF